MKKQTKAVKSLTTPSTLIGALQQVADAVEAKPAVEVKAKVVALRGGSAISTVTTAGAKPYRTAAKHNTDWYAQVQSACKDGPAPVTELIKQGVPSHFLGYCVRRGYALGK